MTDFAMRATSLKHTANMSRAWTTIEFLLDAILEPANCHEGASLVGQSAAWTYEAETFQSNRQILWHRMGQQAAEAALS